MHESHDKLGLALAQQLVRMSALVTEDERCGRNAPLDLGQRRIVVLAKDVERDDAATSLNEPVKQPEGPRFSSQSVASSKRDCSSDGGGGLGSGTYRCAPSPIGASVVQDGCQIVGNTGARWSEMERKMNLEKSNQA